ncbi:LCP family protein [Brachybacterium sp. Marseille-Q7125]|uniref:LCP family protein n=1 Tax=Brachybacterium sp. Marseille-Q7125 TaxID=2932815 RepID=UPI001FF37B2D|nr:LCP family protein [Brachybacterium sp. Marseille-Q7125]
MTDSSSMPRRRRQKGRHRKIERPAQSTPLPDQEARRRRDAAFGHASQRRTWVVGPQQDEVEPQQAEVEPQQAEVADEPAEQVEPVEPVEQVEPIETVAPPARPRGRRAAFPLDQLPEFPPEAMEQDAPENDGETGLDHEHDAEVDAWSASSAPEPEPEPESEPEPTPEAEPDPETAPVPEPAAVAARRTEHGPVGSLPQVAGWTILTSLVPGTGLLTTRLRRVGAVLLGILLVVGLAVGGLLLFGDPLRTAATFASRRGILIAAMIVLAVAGVVWALQIIAANLAHSARQRLEGAKRHLALVLAAVMVLVVAVPFGRGVQSLWALQGLMGSRAVFTGGNTARDHRLQEGKDPWAGVGRLNIMLLGQDAGADRTGTRPDAIMVASIDTETGKTALFSIPRNLEHVRFPEGTPAAKEFPDGFRYYGPNQDLINAVWSWAEDRPDLFEGDPEPGLTATRWAVEETLGLEMDYYAMVNLQGFEDLVDALGGVDLVVERRIPIGGGASQVEGYIEPGAQTLDGFHALWYARSREGSDDFNRMCRQQRIVRAIAEEADPTSIALSIPKLVKATETNIVTDLPVNNLDAFVELALRIKEGGFTSYPITQDVTFSGNADWDYLKEWTQASIEDSMQRGPESVKGETEPGSTEPAETGAPPEEDTEDSDTGKEGSDTGEDGAAEEKPTKEESSDGQGSSEKTEAPEVEQDPLKSCLPGADQSQFG